MTSEIKVDTISEQTSANGVTIDGLTIKDGNIIGDVALAGTTPTFTIGDAGAEDAALIFDGNALDYYIALDDSADNLIIGSGSTVGSNSLITIDSDGDLSLDIAGDILLDAGGADIRMISGGTDYCKFTKDGNNTAIKAQVSDGDLILRGSDGGSQIDALTLDMSDAGSASFNHDVKLPDNAKLKLGNSGDLQIYHDGSTSYLDDNGEGDFGIRSNGTKITLNRISDGHEGLKYTLGGSLLIKHNNSTKLETTASGVDITGGFAATAASTITTADNTDTLSLISTDADANAGPNLRLYRNSSSPADNDTLGLINFVGRNDNSQDVEYAKIRAFATDVSDGSEDVLLAVVAKKDGTDRDFLKIGGSEVVLNEDSQDVDFRVESDGNANMLFVNGGTNKVGIGTNVPAELLEVEGTGAAIQIDSNGDSALRFATGGTVKHSIFSSSGVLNFFDNTNSATRMSIDAAGLVTTQAAINDLVFNVKNTATSGNVFGQQINFSSTQNDTGGYFFRCVGNNNSTVRAVIFANGDFDSATNSYGATSDERIKQNITDANSQWDDIKALKVRNFKLKDEARTEADGGQAAKTYLGLVAQETETVSPGLVKSRDPEKADILSSSEFGTLYEDGDDIPEGKAIGDIKTTTNEKVKSVSYSVLYMKAIKALQEAQTRIETLETKVAALEG